MTSTDEMMRYLEAVCVKAIYRDNPDVPVERIYGPGGHLDGWDKLRPGEKFNMLESKAERDKHRESTKLFDEDLMLKLKPGPGNKYVEKTGIPQEDLLRVRGMLMESWAGKERLWRKADSTDDKMAYAAYGISTGLILFLAGTITWYCLLQRHEDKQAKYQAMKTKADALKKPETLPNTTGDQDPPRNKGGNKSGNKRR